MIAKILRVVVPYMLACLMRLFVLIWQLGCPLLLEKVGLHDIGMMLK